MLMEDTCRQSSSSGSLLRPYCHADVEPGDYKEIDSDADVKGNETINLFCALLTDRRIPSMLKKICDYQFWQMSEENSQMSRHIKLQCDFLSIERLR